MQVILSRNFFTPDGQLIKSTGSPIEINDAWADRLPKGTKIVEGTVQTAEKSEDKDKDKDDENEEKSPTLFTSKL